MLISAESMGGKVWKPPPLKICSITGDEAVQRLRIDVDDGKENGHHNFAVERRPASLRGKEKPPSICASENHPPALITRSRQYSPQTLGGEAGVIHTRGLHPRDHTRGSCITPVDDGPRPWIMDHTPG